MSGLSAWLHGARRWSLPGVVGLACLLAALVLQLTVGSSLADQRKQQQTLLAELQQRLLINGAAQPARDESAAAQLQRFYAGFPTVQTAADWLVRIQSAAQRSGIELQAGEYRLEQRSGDRLRRYAIVLPLRGSYAQIRGFVENTLSDVPLAALDDIELHRDNAASGVLDARVRLTLYLKGGA